jgi:hypothetical protein
MSEDGSLASHYEWGVRWLYEDDSVDSYDEKVESEEAARAIFERSNGCIAVLRRELTGYWEEV